MGDTKSISTTSSGDKKRKRAAPAYFAVRRGRTPGIYYSWADAQEQINQFPGSEYKKFTAYADAEAFLHSASSSNTAASKPKPGQEKWYGVQVGHTPGVYTDYEEVKRQIRGYPGSKQQRFTSREEAQAFVDARNGGGGTPAYASAATSTAPTIKEDMGSDIILQTKTTALRKTPKADNGTKKQKKNDGTPAVFLPNGEIEPGTGPLPADSEDGFDRTIALRKDTGRIEFKTEAELNARKWQPTGDLNGDLVIYTDGAAPGNGRLGAVAGIGVYFGPQNPNNVAEPLGEGRQTNQRAELAAIRRAVDIAPINRSVTIKSDSHYAIQCVTVWFQKWESNDWKTANGKSVDNRDLVEPILERIRERLQAGAKTVFQWVKGHSTDPGNIAADQLAVQGAEMGRQIIAERENQEEAEKSRQRLGRFDGQVGADVGGEGVPEQEQHEGEWAWINDVRNHAQES